MLASNSRPRLAGSMDAGGAAPSGYSGQDRVIGPLLGSGRNAAILRRGGLDRAMAAGVRLGLARPGFGGGGRGYNPDEPRDSHGRWTTGGGGSAGLGPGLLGRVGPTPNGLYGGRLFRIAGPGSGMGDNEPPEGAEEFPEAEPSIDTPRVPQGWDVRPGETVGGLHYDPVRRPVMADGTPWPVATHDKIKAMLAPQKGAMPALTVFVPQDGIGPILMGSTAAKELDQPKGYDAVTLAATPQGYDVVTFKGTPQATYSKGAETPHATESIKDALAEAATNRFSNFLFNRSLSQSTEGLIQSLLRPDYLAIARPQFSDPFKYHPYEVLSGRQNLPSRQSQMPPSPHLAPVRGKKISFRNIFSGIRSARYI